jgi:hypothetical protein
VTNACARLIRRGGILLVGNLILAPDLDADGDGLPNQWEQDYHLDPLQPSDATNDNDHDGMTNAQEYQAGTNPTNANSRLQLAIPVVIGHDVLVSWSAVGGKTYFVQTNGNLQLEFGDLTSAITIPGSGETTTNYLDIGATTNGGERYYRIRVGP